MFRYRNKTLFSYLLLTVQQQAKDLSAANEAREKQVEAIKRSVHEAQAAREAELEKKVLF